MPLGSNQHHLYEPLPDEVDQYVSDSKLEVIGKFGQIFVPEKKARIAKQVNKIVPSWWLFAWGPSLHKRDVSITSPQNGKVGITNFYVVKKPSFSSVA